MKKIFNAPSILSLLLLLAIVYFSIKHISQKKEYTELRGGTFGTYYSIVYQSKDNLQKGLDSLLRHYSEGVSKYIPESEISEFNREGKVAFRSPYLKGLLNKMQEIYAITAGALDPTVMPLVNAWGFGTDQSTAKPDAKKVESLLTLVDFKAVVWNDTILYRTRPGILLDLNAVGEGYAIDLIGQWLEHRGIDNYKIEIGGEVLCKGVNKEGNPWRIGIENPRYDQEGQRPLMAIVTMENAALGTSGNYRNFYIDEQGNKRPHIIDPRIGYPVAHNLLSATVKSPSCVLADGLATACMVLGLEESKKLIEKLEQVEAFLIYEEQGKLKSWHSEKLIPEKKVL